MVLIFNSTVSRENSGTNFTRVRLSGNFIATQPNTSEIYPEFHSYPCYYIHMYMYVSLSMCLFNYIPMGYILTYQCEISPSQKES